MVYPNANPNRTPLVGIEILSTALPLPAPTSLDNLRTAVIFPSKNTAQRRFGDWRRFDSDVGERFTDAEVTSCRKSNSKTKTETMVAFISA